MGNQIYTIGREFGSAGYEVGRLLAERLGVKLYDKDLLAQAAKDSGFCEEIFENHDEKQLFIFISHGYIFRRKLFIRSIFGYAIKPQGFPCTV